MICKFGVKFGNYQMRRNYWLFVAVIISAHSKKASIRPKIRHEMKVISIFVHTHQKSYRYTVIIL